MLNGTNFTLNSDLALVSTQVKTLLYIVGQKARESFDTSMSTCDGVRHIPERERERGREREREHTVPLKFFLDFYIVQTAERVYVIVM